MGIQEHNEPASVILEWIIQSKYLPEGEILKLALESAVRMTESSVGYIHLLDENHIAQEFYTGSEEDFRNTHFTTHESISVFEKAEIRLVLGVGNKAVPYDESDKKVLVFVGNEVWQIIFRKRMEEDLRRREEQLHDAQDLAQIASWEFDLSKQKFTYSPQFPKILNVDPNTIPDGRHMLFARIPANDSQLRKHIEEMFLGHLLDGENEISIEMLGKEHHLHLRYKTLKDEDHIPNFVYGTIQDVTEQKKSELKIQHSEWNLRSIIECSPNGILILKGRKIQFANRASAKLLETHLFDLLDKDIARVIPVSELKSFRDFLSELEEASSLGRLLERNVRLKSGKKRWLGIWTIEIMYDGDVANLVHLIDLSRQKEQELQLLQSEKLATIGQLAAGVAHEINNPVAFIRSNLECMVQYQKSLETFFDLFLKLQNTKETPEFVKLWNELKAVYSENDMEQILSDMRSLASESLEGAKRVSEIVLEIKSFAHVEKEEGPDDFIINDVVRSSLNWIWNKIKYDCDVNLKLAPNLPTVQGRSQQIGQVLLNVLLNAAHAIEERKRKDPVFATSSGKPGKIEIETSIVKSAFDSGADGILITIEDNGIGIPKEVANQIFDPFFTTKEVGEGTGLGLSISVDIIKKQGGRIFVESDPYKFTKFSIMLVTKSEKVVNKE
ncbi:PAS domain S-box protein [Leptospira ryugenii]|uniref:histidine kinase n=1 Tax=Leptospira ryugenii TaxID=1917863 RepID=A0A2P2E182_9LEPT|nr:ATP-binding protein [Leptospira ryugenii]GBF50643.1 PAS domain S-box protein [Leptospira ryugenii]